MTEQKLYPLKFCRLKTPVGYVNLHDALNCVGQSLDPEWAVGRIWKSLPFFYANQEFERFKKTERSYKREILKFKPAFVPDAIKVAKSFRAAVDHLSRAFELQEISGYAVTSADHPLQIPKGSVQWISQEKVVFSTGYMKRRDIGQRYQRIIVKKDELDRWLKPDPYIKGRILSEAMASEIVRLLQKLSEENEAFRYSEDRLWVLLKNPLNRYMTKKTFDDKVFTALGADFKKKPGRGASLGADLKNFDRCADKILDAIHHTISLASPAMDRSGK